MVYSRCRKGFKKFARGKRGPPAENYPAIDDRIPVGNDQYDVTQIKSTISIRDQQAFTRFLRNGATNLQAIGPEDQLSGLDSNEKQFTLVGSQIRLRALLVFVPNKPITYNLLPIIQQIEEETQTVIKVVPLPNFPED
jgi:hypothetical protein